MYDLVGFITGIIFFVVEQFFSYSSNKKTCSTTIKIILPYGLCDDLTTGYMGNS